FGPKYRGLAFSEDGGELAALVEDTFVGWRVVTWDFQKRAVKADHPVPKGDFHGEFFYREGPPIEWLPGRKGWVLFGQAVIDYQTGGQRATLPIENEHRQNLRRVLTPQHVVECTPQDVRIVPIAPPKGP